MGHERQGSHLRRIETAIHEAMGEFLARESNRTSLITLTRVQLTDDNVAVCYVTVLPETAEPSVIHFLRRLRTEAREHLKERGTIGRIPGIDFMIDEGEKHRRHLDTLSDEVAGV